MFCKTYQPHPALKEFINNILVYDMSTDPTLPAPIFPLPPLPENFLFIYVYDSPEVEYIELNCTEKMPLSIVIGQQTSRIQLRMPIRNVCVRVAFQPGGLYRLLSMPLNKYFLHTSVDSDELFKNDIKIIREQLQEVGELDKMAAIVENYFLKKITRLKSKLPLDSVLSLVISHNTTMSIEKIAQESCVSFRQLERQFYQRVGVSPKFFLRLTRFTKAWMMKEQNPSVSWINIAYQCGYFDQMHLIRDFKEFAGVSPSVIEADIVHSVAFKKTGLDF